MNRKDKIIGKTLTPEEARARQEATRAYLARLNAAFDLVIRWVFERGSLTQFPRVVQYIGKQNGGLGWEDSYQNILIDRLLKSPWMKRESQSSFTCTKDNTSWYHTNDEWRMLAYKQTLSLARPEASKVNSAVVGAPAEEGVFFSTDFFRTAGMDPQYAKRVDLNGIVKYLTTLTDGEYLDLIGNPQHPAIKAVSFWRRLLRKQ